MKKLIILGYLEIIFFLITGCQQDDKLVVNGKIIPVRPGENIQEALDQAKSGDIILVSPGTYKPNKKGEAFIIFKKRHNGVTLKGGGIGPEDVVLDGDQ